MQQRILIDKSAESVRRKRLRYSRCFRLLLGIIIRNRDTGVQIHRHFDKTLDEDRYKKLFDKGKGTRITRSPELMGKK